MTNLVKSNMFVYITDKLGPSITLDSSSFLHNYINPAHAMCYNGPQDTLYVYTLVTEHDFDYNCLIDIGDPGYMKLITNEPVTVEPRYQMDRGVGGIYAIKPFKEKVTNRGLYYDKLTTHINLVFGKFRGYCGLVITDYCGVTGAKITFTLGNNDIQLDDDQMASNRLIKELRKYSHKRTDLRIYVKDELLCVDVSDIKIAHQIERMENIN